MIFIIFLIACFIPFTSSVMRFTTIEEMKKTKLGRAVLASVIYLIVYNIWFAKYFN
jgi:hypothetical protein